jgi:uncharacterized RDD family membrane protein YckC
MEVNILQGRADPSTGNVAFGGFWRRVAAFAVDALALAALGQVVGILLADPFARAGEWGRLIGFGLALAWFVPFDSRLGGGRSPGKQLLGLRVARLDGTPCGVGRASARCAILLLPFFLNGAPLPASLLFGPGVYAVSLLVFGIGLVSLYLFAFDRRTHRALHDRLTRTAVFRLAAAPAGSRPTLGAGHRAAIAVLIAFTLAAPLALRHLVRAGPLVEIAQLYAAVTALPGVRYAGVADTLGPEEGPQGTDEAHVVSVDAVVDRDVARPGTLPEKIAAVVFASFPGAAAADRIVIELRHGFDIGIASRFERRAYDRTPAQWREAIAGDSEG